MIYDFIGEITWAGLAAAVLRVGLQGTSARVKPRVRRETPLIMCMPSK